MGRPIYLEKKSEAEELEVDVSGQVHLVPDDRLIVFGGSIDEQPISSIIASILQMFRKDTNKPIHIIINTPGGSVTDALALYDVITYLKSKNVTIYVTGLGKIMSAGIFILVSGSQGHRRIGKHSSIMLHNIYETSASGDVFDMESELTELKRLHRDVNNIISSNTKLSVNQIEELLNKKVDLYISAEKAIEFGLADKILGEE